MPPQHTTMPPASAFGSKTVHSTARVTPLTQSRTANSAQRVIRATQNDTERIEFLELERIRRENTQLRQLREKLELERIQRQQRQLLVRERLERERLERERERCKKFEAAFATEFPDRPLNVALLPERVKEPLQRYIETGNEYALKTFFVQFRRTDDEHDRILAADAAAHTAAVAANSAKFAIIKAELDALSSDKEFQRRAWYAANPRMVDGDIVTSPPEHD